MKYLGLDYGTKRIGIAISDDNGEFAFPKMIVSPDQAVEKITQICESEGIQAIVIGKSVASNGVENDIDAKITSFKEKISLAAKPPIPVYFQQEGYSSMEAHRYQTESGSRDDSAAAIILQRFLDAKKMRE